MNAKRWIRLSCALLAVAFGCGGKLGAQCLNVTFSGEVGKGKTFVQPIGQGLEFRVAPIHGYDGWDLEVDRVGQGNYPDALMVATLPYLSTNPREIGPTFGMRAQDAIAWNPRSFQFLTRPEDYAQAQAAFRVVTGKGVAPAVLSKANGELIALVGRASQGQLRVVDARLVAGVGDPTAFAQQWAQKLGRTSHTFVQPQGAATARGSLEWMRFEVKLLLPGKWKVPAGVKAMPAGCNL